METTIFLLEHDDFTPLLVSAVFIMIARPLGPAYSRYSKITVTLIEQSHVYKYAITKKKKPKQLVH